MTSVRDASSLEKLFAALGEHARYLDENQRRAARRKDALHARMAARVSDSMRSALWQNPMLQRQFDAIFERVTAGALPPWRAARELAESLRIEPRSSR